jgi:hypothetical protein
MALAIPISKPNYAWCTRTLPTIFSCGNTVVLEVTNDLGQYLLLVLGFNYKQA